MSRFLTLLPLLVVALQALTVSGLKIHNHVAATSQNITEPTSDYANIAGKFFKFTGTAIKRYFSVSVESHDTFQMHAASITIIDSSDHSISSTKESFKRTAARHKRRYVKKITTAESQ